MKLNVFGYLYDVWMGTALAVSRGLRRQPRNQLGRERAMRLKETT